MPEIPTYPKEATNLELLTNMAAKESQEAEQRAIKEYRDHRYPEDLLRDRIYGIIACAASATIDAVPLQRPVEPVEWRENLNRTSSRLQHETLFHRMVQMMTHEITEEVGRYEKGIGLDYQRHVLGKVWAIANDEDSEADYDTNNLYDLVREGFAARKRLADGKHEIKEFIAGRPEEALVEFDRVMAERERCLRHIYALEALLITTGESSGIPFADFAIRSTSDAIHKIRDGQ